MVSPNKRVWGLSFTMDRSSHQRCSVKKDVLRNFAKFIGKHLCQSLFFNKVAGGGACNFIKKETLAQVFSSEFCEISKNTLFTEHLRATASVYFTQMINCVERYVKHRKFIFLYVIWQIYCNIGRYRYCMSWLWYLLRYHG